MSVSAVSGTLNGLKGCLLDETFQQVISATAEGTTNANLTKYSCPDFDCAVA